MNLTVLTENVAGSRFLAEHGLSYLIELNGDKILFDAGHSDVFLRNAQAMHIDLNAVRTVVLSHGHWDHGNGVKFLEKKTLIAHPGIFIKRYRKGGSVNIGLKMTSEQIKKKFDFVPAPTPFLVRPDLIFLGQVPRLNDFESKTTPFVDEQNCPDFVPDDSALAAISPKGLIIITGCSHSGICNIIEYAKRATGIDRVNTVIGGFHLKHDDIQTQRTIDYLKEQEIVNVFPSHCTEAPAMAAFYRHFGATQVKTGSKFEF